MSKRPTPKQRLCNSRGGNRYGAYLRKQWKKLRNKMNSPYAVHAAPKKSADAAIDKITKIKA